MRRLLGATLLLSLPAVGILAQDARWPGLDKQLAEDRVPPGSALEALIKENQDFEMLRAEEARDTIRAPLWLRVLWRKSHPQGRYSADDAAGGYPLHLKEIHEWMETHPDLVPGERERDVPPRPMKAAAGRPNLRISGTSPVPRSESDIRVNFWDPRKIIAAANNISGSGAQAQFYSRDGGMTWGRTTLPFQSGESFHTDPTVDWTSDGTAWATTIGVSAGGLVTRIRAYRSLDGGATWTLDGTVSGDHYSADKQMVWVDHSGKSPYRDTLYAIWHDGGPVYVNRRLPGKGWQKPVLVSGKQPGTGIGSDIKTNSAGVVFGFWPNTATRKIQVVRSTDGGRTWSVPAPIATTLDAFDIGIPAQGRRRVLIYVSGGTYRGDGRNHVYAAWTDLSSGSCRAAVRCKTRVWFTRSTDGGRTWGKARMVNNQPVASDQFNQALAVDETNGNLALIYYDTVGDPARRKAHVWYQSSYDGGATWTKSFQVTTAPTDETVRGAEYGNQYGDYNGLSGFAGTFFPSWTDRRNGGKEEIWTAPLIDKGPPE